MIFEFIVIRKKGTFDFSKYRKECRASKVVSFWEQSKYVAGIIIPGRLITTR